MTPLELRQVELRAQDEARLQRFFERNPAYFLAVNGEPPGPAEARSTFTEVPPPGFGFTSKHVLGWESPDGELAAMADVITDLLAPGIWHIGLFIVATGRHGKGDAHRIFDALQSWSVAAGAQWLRLGVVRGNARAERFWAAMGFEELRVREGVRMGSREHCIRVMFKPLAAGTRAQYLSNVPRDRADAP